VTAVTEAHSERSKGIILVAAAAIAWSTAPFFTRLLHFDSWTILFWRGLFGAIAIVALMSLIQGRDAVKDLAAMGRSGWLVARLFTSPTWRSL
jgi:EamA domain-containing membrane protein RarD